MVSDISHTQAQALIEAMNKQESSADVQHEKCNHKQS